MLHTYLMYNTVVRLCHFFCCCGKVRYYDQKKKFSRLSGGCAIVITTGKKSSSRDFYAKLNVSNLNVMNLY